MHLMALEDASMLSIMVINQIHFIQRFSLE